MARIGIFGGTFDPVHYGHLILAERCRDIGQLDRIIFVPVKQSPLKPNAPIATDSQRLEMLSLAISGHLAFEPSMFEIESQDANFTVDTLRHFANELASNDLFFLLGSDALASFADWKQPDQICQLATLLVVMRPPSPAIDISVLKQFLTSDQVSQIQQNQIQSPLIDINSTDIRRRIQADESIRFLLPRSIEKYIESQNVYQ